ncbi:MAG: iron-containing redox enzyme family protein [Arenicella sp.]|nr:iron-containing redox enzyme family protein [Arenicella sp.]
MNSLDELHQSLAFIYDHDFSSASIEHVDSDKLPIFRDVASVLEESMLGYERSLISTEEIESYPEQGDEYVKWLKKMISDHQSSVHPLYNQYMAESATASDLALFLAQETSLDPRFDDILALMQIGTQGAEKLEIANNYYDEMGNGNSEEVHTVLFAKALKELNIDEKYINDNMLLDSIVAGNLSSCLSLSRRHYYKSVGYFGVTEYLAPRRFKHVVAAWNRNNLPPESIIYHKIHIAIDTVHARGWLNNIIAPLVNQSPAIGREIALGAMIRLNSSERYLDSLNSLFASKKAA